MRKFEVNGWSLLEVEMDVPHRTFTVKRRLEKNELSEPGLKPSFIFLTSFGSQILVNEHGYYILRWKKPKSLPQPLTPNDYKPKLSKVSGKSPHGRLAKKAMKQLFASGKITKE